MSREHGNKDHPLGSLIYTPGLRKAQFELYLVPFIKVLSQFKPIFTL